MANLHLPHMSPSVNPRLGRDTCKTHFYRVVELPPQMFPGKSISTKWGTRDGTAAGRAAPQEHGGSRGWTRCILEGAGGSGAGSTSWSPDYRWQWGHPRSCQEPSDAGSQAWVALGELATDTGQQQNASFRARQDRHTAAAATPLFQGDMAPAKPCPVQDSHWHQFLSTGSEHK